MNFLDQIIQTAVIPVKKIPAKGTNEQALKEMGLTLDTPLGKVVGLTDGILLDSGWLRLLGGADSDYTQSIKAYTDPFIPENSRYPGMLVVGYDIIGGVFAVSRIKGIGTPGTVSYMAPDTLEWESLELGYTAFLLWAISEKFRDFYTGYQWPNFQTDSEQLLKGMAYNIYPPLWSKEAKDIEKMSRKAVPLLELWDLFDEYRSAIDRS